MYAVIFRAEIYEIDESYSELAVRMRELAIEKYGCTEFTSVTEGRQEIAISYWKSQEDIEQWKRDAEHLAAQERGRAEWYRSYRVEVVEILREYTKNT